MKDKAFLNFIRHLNWNEIPARQRVLAAFVLTSIMDGYRLGQEACLHHLLADECCKLLESADEVRTRSIPLSPSLSLTPRLSLAPRLSLVLRLSLLLGLSLTLRRSL